MTGGFSAPRLDRAEIRARLPDVERWILDELLDAFEPAALAALRQSQEANRRRRDAARRPEGRPQTSED